MRTISIVVPDGAVPGVVLQIEIAPGRVAQVAVPEGATPGTVLQLEVPELEESSKTSAAAAPRRWQRPPPLSRDHPWRDGNDAETDDDEASASEEGNEEGPTYSSGDDDGVPPALLSPAQWRERHVRAGRCSRFRSNVRPFRTHYFHNQHDADLALDAAFLALISAPILPSDPCALARIPYDSIASVGCDAARTAFIAAHIVGARGGGGDGATLPPPLPPPAAVASSLRGLDYCVGAPALLVKMPGTIELQAAWSHARLTGSATEVEGGYGDARFRVCHAFDWGGRKEDGRMGMRDFLRYTSEYAKADAPFYIFDADIGGRRHMVGSYGALDAHMAAAAVAAAAAAANPAADAVRDSASAAGGATALGRHGIARDYALPSLFDACCLRVPESHRPAATRGVLLVGRKLSGSFPHVDPTATAAWNWLVSGTKRWCLFPPHISKEVVLGALYQHEQAAADKEEEEEEEHEQSEEEKRAALLASTASYWWRWVYPALRARGAELGMVECVQHPGEMIYVPQGWWHAVLNTITNNNSEEEGGSSSSSSESAGSSSSSEDSDETSTERAERHAWVARRTVRKKLKRRQKLDAASNVTVAITHNFVPLEALPSAFAIMARDAPLFAYRWWIGLKHFAPAEWRAVLEAEVPGAVASANAAGAAWRREGRGGGGGGGGGGREKGVMAKSASSWAALDALGVVK